MSGEYTLFDNDRWVQPYELLDLHHAKGASLVFQLPSLPPFSKQVNKWERSGIAKPSRSSNRQASHLIAQPPSCAFYVVEFISRHVLALCSSFTRLSSSPTMFKLRPGILSVKYTIHYTKLRAHHLCGRVHLHHIQDLHSRLTLHPEIFIT